MQQGCRSVLREIKNFTDKKKLREFGTTMPALQELPKARNPREENEKGREEKRPIKTN